MKNDQEQLYADLCGGLFNRINYCRAAAGLDDLRVALELDFVNISREEIILTGNKFLILIKIFILLLFADLFCLQQAI